MQIEKINNNKLKVILNTRDLEKKHIDLNTFMSNSLESQELFLDILDLAEEEFNFYVDNSKLIVESISLANNIFIFTITKLNTLQDIYSDNYIYCFDNFNHFYQLFSLFKEKNKFNIYTYNNQYYLVVNKTDSYNDIINEFCTQKISSYYLESILIEHGKNMILK